MRSMWTRAVLVGALGLAAGSTGGCASERAPINRVQADALAKSFFVGADLKSSDDDPEFYTRSTVVDVGYGAMQDGLFNSSWAQADLSRIKWVIQENLLIARLTYERIDGSDGKGAGKATNDGTIVAVYPVISHFDIKRDYNPTTGEESNVIVENSSDRPWYEREYFRVDWSQNLNQDSYDFDTLSIIGVYGGVHYEPLAYYVNDPNSPDAPHFDAQAGYFDVTNKSYATPQTIDLSSLGWGIDNIPACFLDNDFFHGTAPMGNCNPVEITVRHSFRKVVESDYEPVDWDGHMFSAYGPFTNERMGYARNYGMSDDQWHRFANRYNIWEKSHYYDANGKPVECYTDTSTLPGQDAHRDDNNDGTDDECAAVGRGSHCDTFKQKCTLPYRDRVAKPLQWYYTEGSNPEFFDGTDWAVHEWDVAMRSAIQVAKYAECKRLNDGDDCSKYPVYTGQMDDQADAIWLAREVDDCRRGLAYSGQNCDSLADKLGGDKAMDAGVIALAKMPEMIVLCHSPVAEKDPESCGAKGMVVRMGDLRYHNVNAFTAPQTPSAWGIYTDSEDPLTGEKISASINIWTHVNDLWSQGVVDTVRYIKGELKTEDITNGTYIHDWVSANDKASNQNAVMNPMTRDQYNERLGGAVGLTREQIAKQLEDIEGGKVDPKVKAMYLKARDIGHETRADIKGASANRAVYEARRAAARGTPMEAELMTKGMQQYSGVEGLPLTDEILNTASPMRGADPALQREFRRAKELAFANKGACVMDAEAPAPLAIAGLADELEEKFGAFEPAQPNMTPDKLTELKQRQAERAEKMRKWLAQRAQYGVIIHEMGHSIGMRHNFLSSYDSFNYRPQYWQLRTNDGTLKTECKDLSANGEDCVGPRYFDPVTENEKKNLIWMWSQSSVMDYPGDHTMDTIGLGAYDFAAARMFYGQMVAVFADPSYVKGDKSGRATGVLDRLDSFGGLLGLDYVIGAKSVHYSQLNANYDLLIPGQCHEVDPASYKPATWNDERDGAYHPVLDAAIVKVNGKYTKCKQQKVDYVPYQSLSDGANVFNPIGLKAFDQGGRIRVPYPFATDSWADLGNLSVYRHDNGADPYELVNFWVAQQEVNHIFDNYRRNRKSFSVRSAANRTLERYDEKMRDAAKGLGLIRNIINDISMVDGSNSEASWKGQAGFFKDQIMLSGIVFDHFAREMSRPSPGMHTVVAGEGVLRSLDNDGYLSGPTKVIIPNGVTGGYDGVGIGGRPLENALSEDKGEYDRDYTLNCGSYYAKVNVPYLLSESEDNFISSSRGDFLDPRFRAVSIADLFPDGYRRFMANMLTGDDFIKGARLTANASNNPEVETNSGDLPEIPADIKCTGAGCAYPKSPMGWTSWWPTTGAESCFPNNGSIVCKSYIESKFQPEAPANTIPVDPQVGWEQQKFLIAQTFVYLPENQQQKWFEMMSLWELGKDADPGFANRIEYHNPGGSTYIAKTYGKEDLFGKTVQKGIAARVLEWANGLLVKAYQTTPVDIDGDGVTDWYEPVLGPDNQPIVISDAAKQRLERYTQVIWFLSNSPYWMHLDKKGIYD